MTKDARECPDCEGSMHEIRIIDKASHNLPHYDLEYAAADADRSFWFGQFPIAGKIAAYMCQECGGVRLFGRSSN